MKILILGETFSEILTFGKTTKYALGINVFGSKVFGKKIPTFFSFGRIGIGKLNLKLCPITVFYTYSTTWIIN